eukprot:7179106-Prymnesium_polylepis.2
MKQVRSGPPSRGTEYSAHASGWWRSSTVTRLSRSRRAQTQMVASVIASSSESGGSANSSGSTALSTVRLSTFSHVASAAAVPPRPSRISSA